jgi:hypothetical protein
MFHHVSPFQLDAVSFQLSVCGSCGFQYSEFVAALFFECSCCRLHRQVTSEFSATLSKLQDLHDTQAVTRTATRGTWGIESAGKVGSEVGSAQELLALARFKTSLQRSVSRSGREIYGKPMEIAMAILQTIN